MLQVKSLHLQGKEFHRSSTISLIIFATYGDLFLALVGGNLALYLYKKKLRIDSFAKYVTERNRYLIFKQEEAERWKKRGNHLSKESDLVDLAIAYYSLALNFAPSEEKGLKAAILSNRCLMFMKTGRDEDALKDAKLCVDNNPEWPKVMTVLCSGFV